MPSKTRKRSRNIKNKKPYENNVSESLSESNSLVKDDEERRLEALLFGEEAPVDDVIFTNYSMEPAAVDDKADEEDEETGDPLSFYIDTQMDDPVEPGPENEALAEPCPASEDKPVWQDTSNNTSQPVSLTSSKRLHKLRSSFSESHVSLQEYESRLRSQFVKVHPTPDWARLPEASELNKPGSGLLSILRSTEDLVDARKAMLKPDTLAVFRVKDANHHAYSQAVIQSARCHPKVPLIFTCGLDKTLRFFQLDGRQNSQVTSVSFSDMPIFCAEFINGGSQVLVSGRRPYFYVYDLVTQETSKVWGIRGAHSLQKGKQQPLKSLEKFKVSPCTRKIAFLCPNGHILLVSPDTKQKIGDFKMNGGVTDVSFSSDGNTLYSIGTDSEVYVWDVKTGRCLARFMDIGSIRATCISVSPDGKWLVTGSDSGVVNFYDILSFTSCSQSWEALPITGLQPTSSLMNLTTPITTLVFNHDSQLLAMASYSIKDALRIVYVPQQRVMKNWPTGSTPLGYVSSICFSRGSEYICVGNAKGKVITYQLTAYCQTSSDDLE